MKKKIFAVTFFTFFLFLIFIIKKNNKTEQESPSQNIVVKEKNEKGNEEQNIEKFSETTKENTQKKIENTLYQNENIAFHHKNSEEKNDEKYFSNECISLFENIRDEINLLKNDNSENMKRLFQTYTEETILKSCDKNALKDIKIFNDFINSEIHDKKHFLRSIIDEKLESKYRKNFNINDISSITDPYKIENLIISYFDMTNIKNAENYDDIIQKLLLRLIEVKGHSQEALHLLISAENIRFHYINKEKTCNINDIFNYKPLIEPFEPNVSFEPLTSYTKMLIEQPSDEYLFYFYFQEYLKSPCDSEVLETLFQNIKKPIAYEKNEDYKKYYLQISTSLKKYFKGLASICQYQKNKAPIPKNIKLDEEIPMTLHIYQQYKEGNISLDSISKNSFFPWVFCKYEK